MRTAVFLGILGALLLSGCGGDGGNEPNEPSVQSGEGVWVADKGSAAIHKIGFDGVLKGSVTGLG